MDNRDAQLALLVRSDEASRFKWLIINQSIRPIHRRASDEQFDGHLYRSASPSRNPRNGGITVSRSTGRCSSTKSRHRPVCRCSIVIESLQQWPTKKLSRALYPDDAHRPRLRTAGERVYMQVHTPARGFVWSMRREMNGPANTRDSMDRTCSLDRHLGRYLLDRPIRLSSH